MMTNQADPSHAAEARRTALAVALPLAVYGGLLVLLVGRVRFEHAWASVATWLAGYLLALAIPALSRILARIGGWLGATLALLVRSLGSGVGLAIALGKMATVRELPQFTGAAAFAGATLGLLLSDEFPSRVRNLLLVRERVRAALARRPRLRTGLLKSIRPLVTAGNLAPWVVAALLYWYLPPDLRERLGGYLLIIAYMSRLLVVQVLEEIVVLGFLEFVTLGDFGAAMRLPLTLARLGMEIEAASVELERPLAAYVAHGLNAPEEFPFTPEQMARLVNRFLNGSRRRNAIRSGSPREPDPASAGWETDDTRRPSTPGDDMSPIATLLARGVRFSLAAAGTEEGAMEAGLPAFADLRHGSVRASLGQRFPTEPTARLIARRYERDVRGFLFPVGLLWILLPAVAWWLRETPLWPVPLVLAGLSMALMVWLVVYYAQWVFDESLRVRDFDYLAERLGKRVMLGELEEAMGSRDPRVRELAIELLFFHDPLVSQGFTAPTPGIRKFLKRV
jgi:hypothetical protein